MKVLHVMPSLARSYGGPTQSWVGYARAAETQGISVYVAAPQVSKEDRDWLAGQVENATCTFFPVTGRGAGVVSPKLQKWLENNGRHFDAIHVHGLLNPVSSLALRLSTRKRWPVVLRPFGTLSKYTFFHRRSWLKQKYFQFVDGPSLTKAKGIHFTTPAERDEARWHGINFDDRSHIVPPPLHRPETNVQITSSYPEKEKQTRDVSRVLFLSRLHPVKNVECLIEAWPLVQEMLPDARLVIAGDGQPDYVKLLKQQAEEVKVAENISFVGFVAGAEKARLLAESSVFVLPSYQENFGVAVLEAVGAGLPVVISKQVQLASYINSKKLGLVIKATPESLANAIIKVLKNQQYQQYCRHQGPLSIQEDFSLEGVGRQLASMYRAVIQYTSRSPK